MPPGQGAQKNPAGWEKAVPGPSPGAAPAEGEETCGSENETRLVAAGPPGWAVAGMAAVPGPGGLPRHCGLSDVDSKGFFLYNFRTIIKFLVKI